jgi:hypothetical protein
MRQHALIATLFKTTFSRRQNFTSPLRYAENQCRNFAASAIPGARSAIAPESGVTSARYAVAINEK